MLNPLEYRREIQLSELIIKKQSDFLSNDIRRLRMSQDNTLEDIDLMLREHLRFYKHFKFYKIL